MTPAPELPAYDGIVLAGGAGRRLGGMDKALLTVGGHRLLDRALAALEGAEAVAVVGPRRDVALPRDVTWTSEDPPGSGPPAALAAGAVAVSAPIVVVLAVDTPLVDRPLVEHLVARLSATRDTGPTAEAAVIVDADGYRQPLVAAYRRSALAAAAKSRSLRALLASLHVVEVPDATGASVDADTPTDVALLESRIVGRP